MIYIVLWLNVVAMPVQCTEPNILNEPCYSKVIQAQTKVFETEKQANEFKAEQEKLKNGKDFKVVGVKVK